MSDYGWKVEKLKSLQVLEMSKHGDVESQEKWWRPTACDYG